MRLLFEIEDVFDISGRGCVPVPGVPRSLLGWVKAGSVIVIEPLSGKAVETTIAGFEMSDRGSQVEHAAFSVPRSICKEQIPIGSRVFFRERPLVQYDLVRVRKLVQPADDYDSWHFNERQPVVGETGTLIEVLTAE